MSDRLVARHFLDAGGLCLPHLRAISELADAPALRLLGDAMIAWLGAAADVECLTGLDADAPRSTSTPRWPVPNAAPTAATPV